MSYKYEAYLVRIVRVWRTDIIACVSHEVLNNPYQYRRFSSNWCEVVLDGILLTRTECAVMERGLYALSEHLEQLVWNATRNSA